MDINLPAIKIGYLVTLTMAARYMFTITLVITAMVLITKVTTTMVFLTIINRMGRHLRKK